MATITADKSLYEIVVINNNSTDNTNEVCQKFQIAHPDTQFRSTVEPKVGFYSVRNRAVTEAKFELLAFMDDDQTILPNYVDVIIKTFEDYPEYVAVGGRLFPLGEDGTEPKFCSKFLNPFCKTDLGNVAKDYPHKVSFKNPTNYFPGNGTITFNKEVFEKYGNFGETTIIGAGGEDIYIINKLRQNNEKILYMPDIVIYHHIPEQRCNYKNLMQTAHKGGVWQSLQKRGKFMDRVLKFMLAVGVGIFYFVTFRKIKGRYLIAFQYNWLKGYIKGMKAE